MRISARFSPHSVQDGLFAQFWPEEWATNSSTALCKTFSFIIPWLIASGLFAFKEYFCSFSHTHSLSLFIACRLFAKSAPGYHDLPIAHVNQKKFIHKIPSFCNFQREETELIITNIEFKYFDLCLFNKIQISFNFGIPFQI